MRMVHLIAWSFVGLLGMALAGCETTEWVVPSTDGFHRPEGLRRATVVVWSDEPDAATALTLWLMSEGWRVVERAQVQRVFEEQRFRLVHARDADILRVGHLVGAAQVIFVDVRHPVLGVSLRAVDIESGEVLWAGEARYPGDVGNQSAAVLVQFAAMRALCPTEHGMVWWEATLETGGRSACLRRGTTPAEWLATHGDR